MFLPALINGGRDLGLVDFFPFYLKEQQQIYIVVGSLQSIRNRLEYENFLMSSNATNSLKLMVQIQR